MDRIEEGVKTEFRRLLADDEPAAFSVEHEDGASPFLLICDHASRRIPRALGTLGLNDAELTRHIAWDIGARGVASHLAAILDAMMIAQTYSRLVIDCNRPLTSPTSITTRSERTDVPGNRDLAPANATARAQRDLRAVPRSASRGDRSARNDGPADVLVSVHSFTPVFTDVARPWHIGMLYNRDPRLARALLDLIRAEGRLVVGDNEPYSVSDGTDYSIPVHGEQRGLPHVEIEVRQDLIERGGRAGRMGGSPCRLADARGRDRRVSRDAARGRDAPCLRAHS